jgi:hypothetical protein
VQRERQSVQKAAQTKVGFCPLACALLLQDSYAVQFNRGMIEMHNGFGLPQLIGIIIAAAIAIWVYNDAEGRGMSGVLWGILTFLFCIIALPVYLIVRKPRTSGDF